MGSSSSATGGISLTYESEDSNFDKEGELSELDKTKAGVQGLVDSGISKVPRIFILPKEYLQDESSVTDDSSLQVPVIDLQGCEGERRKDIVSEIRKASETWGIFQLINHGIPQEIINCFLESIREFHEQPAELKGKFYSRDLTNTVCYNFTINRVIGAAIWRDILACYFDNTPSEDVLAAIPDICRKPMSDYIKYVKGLKDTVSELLSEALGLRSDFLKGLECMESQRLYGLYYPACPEPHLTAGTVKHWDASFLTILVQNDISGLQVRYENKWIDVQPKKGAVVVNIGDMLQLISNDIFKSAEHRVLARETGPRLSAACFLCPSSKDRERIYRPIKELSRGDFVPVYREISFKEYLKLHMTKFVGLGFKALTELRQ